MPVNLGRSWKAALVAGVLLAGGLSVLGSTRGTIGVTPDSVEYLHAARSLANGQGLMALGDRGVPEPLTHFPPLYPMVLALPCALGIDPLAASRWLNAAFYVLSSGLVMACIYQQTPGFWSALCGGALFVALGPALSQHVMLWSEPLFLALVLLFVLSMSAYLSDGRWTLLIAAGFCAAGAFLTRYVGASMIVAGGLLCLVPVAAGGRGKRRAGALLAFAVTALSGPVLWLGRNMLGAGTLTHRTLAFHPPGLWRLAGAAPVVTLSALAALAIVLLAQWHRRPGGLRAEAQRRPVLATLLVTTLSYLLLVLFSLTLFDASTMLDDRLMGPAQSLLLSAGVIVYHDALRRVGSPAIRRVAFLVVPLGLLLGGAVRLVTTADGTQRGLGDYTDSRWRRSEVIAFWRNAHGSTITYSNGPEAIYFLSGARVRRIPARFDPYSKTANAAYAAECAETVRLVRSGQAVVVYFNACGYRTYLMSRTELDSAVGDQATRLADGTTFGPAVGTEPP